MRLGIAQFTPEAGAPEANRQTAIEAVTRAADRGADLVVLPEMFTVGYFAFEAYEAAAEAIDGPTVEALATVADARDVAVLTGSFVEDLAKGEDYAPPAGAGLANTSVLLDAEGTIRAWYRKVHLFGYDSEEATRLVPGEHLGVADLGDWRVGIATCYDLRFPELFRRYVDEGVTLMLVPSAWPDARPTHWSVLSQARAIENQWYLAAVNGVGAVSGTELLGRSTVYDPWGEPVLDLEREPATAVVDLDADRVAAVREAFPALADRRDDW
ncbi:MAG: nitrilase-related carbon-nitrogen hydrolase [Halobacteriales archaeon]